MGPTVDREAAKCSRGAKGTIGSGSGCLLPAGLAPGKQLASGEPFRLAGAGPGMGRQSCLPQAAATLRGTSGIREGVWSQGGSPFMGGAGTPPSSPQSLCTLGCVLAVRQLEEPRGGNEPTLFRAVWLFGEAWSLEPTVGGGGGRKEP